MTIIHRIDYVDKVMSQLEFIAALYEQPYKTTRTSIIYRQQPFPEHYSDGELIDWFIRDEGKYHKLPDEVWVTELYFKGNYMLDFQGGRLNKKYPDYKWYYFYKLKEEHNER